MNKKTIIQNFKELNIKQFAKTIRTIWVILENTPFCDVNPRLRIPKGSIVGLIDRVDRDSLYIKNVTVCVNNGNAYYYITVHYNDLKLLK